MSIKTIAIETNGDGEFSYERRFAGAIKAILCDTEDLGTPDIVIDDGVWLTPVLDVAAVEAGSVYQPLVQATDENGTPIADVYTEPAIFGTLRVAITGATATESGTLRVLVA